MVLLSNGGTRNLVPGRRSGVSKRKFRVLTANMQGAWAFGAPWELLGAEDELCWTLLGKD